MRVMRQDAADAADDGARKGPSKPPGLELVTGYQDEEDPQAAEGAPWRIEDLAGLDWALMRLGALEREVEDNEEVLRRRIAELEAKCSRLNERALRGMRFFRSHIEAYCREHRQELLGGGKKKSRSLMHGTVGWRKRPAGLEVVDRAALLEWARKQPVELELVRFHEEPALDAIKRVSLAAGVPPPGTELRPETEEMQVRVDIEKEVL